ncbi:hypothetical protein GCM10027184_41890 [Saccharothrix stipae]
MSKRGGDGTELLEPVEAAFDHVAAFVGGAVEGRWASAGPAASQPVGLLVAAFGDGGRDAASAQMGADGAAGVALVRDHPARPRGGPPRSGSVEPDTGHDLGDMVQSLTLPPVRTIDRGRPWPSQARWILVVGPPRERPMA